MTVTHDGKEFYPQAESNPEADFIEYSPPDETFQPGAEIALSQNQNNIAVAGIFQEVEGPNLNRNHQSIEKQGSFYPNNAKTENQPTIYDHALPDFTRENERGSDSNIQGAFVSFGQKLPSFSDESDTSSLVLSELDATAFDRSDEIFEEPTTDYGAMRQAYSEDDELGLNGFKADFESNFNPGFSNFGDFEGWGAKQQ